MMVFRRADGMWLDHTVVSDVTSARMGCDSIAVPSSSTISILDPCTQLHHIGVKENLFLSHCFGVVCDLHCL